MGIDLGSTFSDLPASYLSRYWSHRISVAVRVAAMSELAEAARAAHQKGSDSWNESLGPHSSDIWDYAHLNAGPYLDDD